MSKRERDGRLPCHASHAARSVSVTAPVRFMVAHPLASSSNSTAQMSSTILVNVHSFIPRVLLASAPAAPPSRAKRGDHRNCTGQRRDQPRLHPADHSAPER
ncbi:hypothetical protein WNY61_09245 [Sulfitobacter sp. AS92]|uniref:hypothetical protein n=1 Tax=Sulfitobacter sp. AS92 TaxID=3135783 RepID=UPI003177939E